MSCRGLYVSHSYKSEINVSADPLNLLQLNNQNYNLLVELIPSHFLCELSFYGWAFYCRLHLTLHGNYLTHFHFQAYYSVPVLLWLMMLFIMCIFFRILRSCICIKYKFWLLLICITNKKQFLHLSSQFDTDSSRYICRKLVAFSFRSNKSAKLLPVCLWINTMSLQSIMNNSVELFVLRQFTT